MSLLRRLEAALRRPDGSPPTTMAGGSFPTSPNRASSFHLVWSIAEPGLLHTAEATLEVLVPPAVPHLYFWALQVSFLGPTGKTGAAHLGLQWYRQHPGSTAVNWGGYGSDGEVLTGTVSTLPSATANPNTRDFPWQAQRPYRLRVSPAPDLTGWWRGEVFDLETGAVRMVRDLHGGGDHLGEVMVWSEVFARCGDPSVVVRWSDPSVGPAGGDRRLPEGARVNYQASEAGGCPNTTTLAFEGGLAQITNTERITPQDAVLDWP